MTELSMLQDGVGFTVYRQEEGIERVWPMDPVPRIIPANEWAHIEKGLVQRILTLNLFLNIYSDRFILRDRVVDPRLVYEGGYFRREFMGGKVPRDVYVHVCGTDLIRDADGCYLRPFILCGEKVTVVPGALTRGSLVVNSSQGGGSKDTWILG